MPDFPVPDYWHRDEAALFDAAIDAIARDYGRDVADAMAADSWLGFQHHVSVWDWEIAADLRAGVYRSFESYVEDEYGVDWDEYYDWDSYREIYDSR